MIIYPIQLCTYRPQDYSKVLGSRKKKNLRSCSSIASKKKKNLNQVSSQEYGAVPSHIALLPNYAVGKSYNGN